MTNVEDFLGRVEREIRNSGSVSASTCEAFADLPLESRMAYDKAMRFLGCETPDMPTIRDVSASEVDRVRASRLMLLRFFREPGNPAWSSWLLDGLSEAVMGTPGGSVGDLLYALHEIFGELSVNLTEPVKNLIKDVVVKSFTENRASYETSDFTGVIRKTIAGATPAQAYLALLAIPPSTMPAPCAVAILKGLEGTPYWMEARDTLDEDLQESRSLDLAEWEADGLRKGIGIGLEQDDRGEAAPLDVDAPLARVRGHRES
jgi:hypothetical protein